MGNINYHQYIDITFSETLYRAWGTSIRELEKLVVTCEASGMTYKWRGRSLDRGPSAPPCCMLSRIDANTGPGYDLDNPRFSTFEDGKKVTSHILHFFKTWKPRFSELDTTEIVGFAGSFLKGTTKENVEGATWLGLLYIIHKIPVSKSGTYKADIGKYLPPVLEVAPDSTCIAYHNFRKWCTGCRQEAQTPHDDSECLCATCDEVGHPTYQCPQESQVNGEQGRKRNHLIAFSQEDSEPFAEVIRQKYLCIQKYCEEGRRIQKAMSKRSAHQA